jgi:hypothetical protein
MRNHYHGPTAELVDALGEYKVAELNLSQRVLLIDLAKHAREVILAARRDGLTIDTLGMATDLVADNCNYASLADIRAAIVVAGVGL